MGKGTDNQGLYIYGIIPTYYPAEQFMKLDSIGVYTVPFKKISAIVSNSPVADVRQLGMEPLARLLIGHQKMIESVMNLGFATIIPMQLGTYSKDTTEVISYLEKGYDLILDTFEKIGRHVEIDIVATWSDFNSILAETAIHPKILEMKEVIVKNGGEVTQSDQLSIGFLVKKLLDEKKSEYAEKIVKVLGGLCQNFKPHEVMNDQMVSNTAFLLAQGQIAMFEKALDMLDAELEGRINFKFVGPLPCYSFYTLEVKELRFEDIDLAKKELGLNNSTSETNIKQAYLEKVKLFHPDANPGDNSHLIFNRVNKAYHTLMDYVNMIKPGSRDESFSLMTEVVAANTFFLKIKE